MFHELRLAARALRRRPLFTAAVTLTLAIGLGANATIFTAVDAVLVRAMPYPEADRLVSVWSTVQRENLERRSVSYPDFLSLRDQAGSLQQAAAWTSGVYYLKQPGDTTRQRLIGTLSSPEYFELLGVKPLLGSSLSMEAKGEGLRQALISESLWRRSLGGDPAVIGRTMELDGESAQVVGVLPSEFNGLVNDSDVWVSLLDVDGRAVTDRGARWLNVVARLAPGTRVENAAAELHTIFAALEAEYPDRNRGYNAALGALRNDLVGDLRVPLLSLFAAAAMLLLIAAVNVSQLLLAHLGRRSQAFAIALALGADRLRLLRSLFAEGLIVSALSAALAVLLSFGGLRVLRELSPVDLPSLFAVAIGGRVLIFVATLAALVALVLTAAGYRIVRRPASAVLQAARSGQQPAQRRALYLALVAQIGLTLMLTVASGLLVKSFQTLGQADLGFDSDRLGFLRTTLPPDLEPPQRAAALTALLSAARADSSVLSAALGTDSPLEGSFSATIVSPEGAEPAPDRPYGGGVRVYRHAVSEGYFSTLGLPLLRGRDFATTDSPDADRGVAVVTEQLAARLWPGRDALGRLFYAGAPAASTEEAQGRTWFEVIGITANHRHRSLVASPDAPPEDPDIYLALNQFPTSNLSISVRARTQDPSPVLRGLQSSLQAALPGSVVYAAQTLALRVGQQTARSRFAGLLMSSFAALSLLLAAVGIWGIVSEAVVSRRREIGIRMALGADFARVVLETSRGPLLTICGGLVLGLLGAMAASRYLESLLYEVRPTEPVVLVASVAVLLGVGLVACIAPASRAGRIHPTEALRGD